MDWIPSGDRERKVPFDSFQLIFVLALFKLKNANLFRFLFSLLSPIIDRRVLSFTLLQIALISSCIVFKSTSLTCSSVASDA